MRVWFAIALACCLLGCTASRAVIASSSDYGDYRRIRVAESAETRMAAAWQYLKRHPEGRFAERIRRYFDRREPVYFKWKGDSVAGLEEYLRALPDGPHAEEAVLRLVALRDRGLSTRPEAVLASIEAEKRARAADKRRAAELFRWWVAQLIDAAIYTRPFDRVEAELVARYELSAPRPA
ncbi:MAG: hypothetical protein AAGA56_13020 [Myxococcota bacterium]